MTVDYFQFLKSFPALFILAGLMVLHKPHIEAVTDLDKPNILFILADDLGVGQVGAYGSKFYETPHIDSIATKGIKFNQAYAASPVCSPTRASILTGQNPARLGLTVHLPPISVPGNSPLLYPEDYKKHLPLDVVTIAEALKKNGYRTASFGKWHLSKSKTPPESLPYNPDKHGFDESLVTYKPVPGMAKPWQTPENDPHNVKLITRKSLEFIENNKDRPFFLYISHNTIHAPLLEKRSLIKKYQNKQGANKSENHAIIGAMMETLDNSVGQILKKIKAHGLENNIMVIFYSDNGGLHKAVEQTPFRRGKADLYEGGIRVPLLIQWPNRIPAGLHSNQVVSSPDFYPTFLEISGTKVNHQQLDGLSLLPVFNEKSSLQERTFFWHYPHYHFDSVGSAGAIRNGDYKLIEFYFPTVWNRKNQVELYNLRDDSGEIFDLSERLPEKTRRLRKKLQQWREAVGAKMPKKNPTLLIKATVK